MGIILLTMFIFIHLTLTFAKPQRKQPPSLNHWRTRIKTMNKNGDSPAVIYPTNFGADMTGKNDSSKAFQAAVNAAFKWAVPGAFISNSTSHGGVVVDLQGGEYLLNTPIYLGTGGNVRICCGSLRAAHSFPINAFLLSGHHPLEDITFENLLLDCQRTGGAISFDNALRVHLDKVYIVHYTSFGIRVTEGHEVHITNSFLGEWIWGENGGGHGTNLTGTAIEIDGQDHWISDIIIFSGLYGIVMNGGAAIITNSHIYNGGQEALRIKGNSNRVLGCYFDFDPVLIIDPLGVDISHCFFLGGVGIKVQSSGTGTICSGLRITDNLFVVGEADSAGPWEAIQVDTSAGKFVTVNETIIARNECPPASYGPWKGQSLHSRSTEVHKTLVQSSTQSLNYKNQNTLPTQLWSFDLSSELAFTHLNVLNDNHIINDISFTVQAEEGFPLTILRPSNVTSKVIVEANTPFSGKVNIIAFQGRI